MASPLVIDIAETPHMGIVKPYDSREKNALATDEEIKAQGGLTELDLVRLLEGTSREPSWRIEADRAVDYYDGHQLDSETLALMEKRGVPPLIINLIQPTVNTVLGMEARNRTDWKVTFDEPEYENVAKAINKKLNDFERMTFADRACSDAYAGQIKSGLAWVEVSRNANPLAASPYKCRPIHRREIWADWWTEDNPDDWRYLIRKRWMDADKLSVYFPDQAELIRYCSNRWSGWGKFTENLFEKTGLARSYDIERAFTVTENEWRDSERNRLVTFEVWYRVWKRGYIATLNNGKRIQVNPNNPRHSMMIAAGALRPMSAAFPVMRQAFFVGPHRLLDRESPLPHQGFPYTPFFGFREDLTRAPYGLIRSMMSPQDEVNARRSRLMALLGSRRAQIDSDALDKDYNDIADAADEVSRADSVLITNPKRKLVNGIKIESNEDLSSGQANILQISKDEIHQASGVFQEVSGQSRLGLSGVALDGLVQQGTTTLAEINDNYQQGRREVGEQAVAFIKADSLHQHQVAVGEGKARKYIILNKPVVDPENGADTVENAVAPADIRVILEDVPSSATYKQQQFQHLAELTKSLPPQLQAFVTDFVIEASDLPERKAMAQRIRRMMNIPDPGAEDDPNGGMPPEMMALKQQSDEQIQLLTQELQAALDEAKKAQMQVADHSDANAIKKYEIDQRTPIDMAAAQAAADKTVSDAAIKNRELDLKQQELDQQAQDMTHQRDVAFTEQLRADATPSETEPAIDSKALLADIMASIAPKLEKVSADVASSVEKVRSEVDKKVGDMTKLVVDQARAEKSEAPATPVVFEPGAITVNVTNEPGKPVKKNITLSADGKHATIEPEKS